jgi:hypothetical protein
MFLIIFLFSFAQSAGNPVDLQRKILWGLSLIRIINILRKQLRGRQKIFPQIQSALQVQLHQGLLSETQLREGSMGTVNPSFRPYGELFGSDNRNPTQTAAKRTPAPFKGQSLGASASGLCDSQRIAKIRRAEWRLRPKPRNHIPFRISDQ